ncbi:MAG: hypothetical protein LBJ61_09145, partial [Deltaproteobacteria bacterium]|nr:hypothetical protein [Deltaproteobacteria bacterium]
MPAPKPIPWRLAPHPPVPFSSPTLTGRLNNNARPETHPLALGTPSASAFLFTDPDGTAKQ